MPKYAIEICGQRNECAIFPPLGYGERLRGRWDMAKTVHRNRDRDEAGQCYNALSLVVSVIPGLFIALDTDAKRGQIVDPLGTPEGQAIQQKIKNVLSQFSSNPLNTGADPRPTQTFDKMSIDDIKTWMFYMRTMLDSSQAVTVPGASTLPDIETIRRMPGRRRSDPACTMQQRARSEQHAIDSGELYQWADEVPPDAQLVGAGAGGGGTGGTPEGDQSKGGGSKPSK